MALRPFAILWVDSNAMKQLFTLLGTLLFLGTSTQAQMVQKCCGTSNSTFLLGNTSFAKHTQCIYLPADLTGAASGPITTLYFRYGSTGEDLGNTLGGLMIRLGLTTETAFAGGNTFFTDLDTVLMAAQYNIPPGIEGDWFSIELDTPFPFEMSETLILDIWFESSTTTNFGTLGTSNTGRKLYSLDLTSPTGTTTSSTWQDIGFDLSLPTGLRAQGLGAFRIHPLPGQDQWQVRWTDTAAADRLLLYDATGRVVSSEGLAGEANSHVLDLSDANAGIYIAELRLRDGTRHTQRFVRP